MLASVAAVEPSSIRAMRPIPTDPTQIIAAPRDSLIYAACGLPPHHRRFHFDLLAGGLDGGVGGGLRRTAVRARIIRPRGLWVRGENNVNQPQRCIAAGRPPHRRPKWPRRLRHRSRRCRPRRMRVRAGASWHPPDRRRRLLSDRRREYSFAQRGTDVVYDPFQQGVIDGLRGDDLHSPPARRRA